jgi:hypothetical protein
MVDPPMHVADAVVVLLLLTAGCANVKPDTTVREPPNAATQPRKPQPAAKPAATSTPRPAPAAAPAASARTPVLDLNTLEAQLKETNAIGFFTKIALKNQVDDLLDQFREYYRGKAKFTMTDLRRSFDLLMMKVLSLLQDEDQKLASSILSSREAIWGLLADPKKFATIQG